MIPKEALLACGLGFERRDGKVLGHQFMEPAADQVGLTTDQANQALNFRRITQGRPIAPIEIRHLVPRKILQSETGTHVKRRLMHVGDEEMRLRRIGNGKRQPPPWTLRVKRTLVVPGAKQTKNLI